MLGDVNHLPCFGNHILGPWEGVGEKELSKNPSLAAQWEEFAQSPVGALQCPGGCGEQTFPRSEAVLPPSRDPPSSGGV